MFFRYIKINKLTEYFFNIVGQHANKTIKQHILYYLVVKLLYGSGLRLFVRLNPYILVSDKSISMYLKKNPFLQDAFKNIQNLHFNHMLKKNKKRFFFWIKFLIKPGHIKKTRIRK